MITLMHLRSTRRVLLVIAAALTLGLAGGAGYWFGVNRAAPDPGTAGAREILYWYDPMRPEVHFDAPGRSPFMDMDLVPRYADEANQSGNVRIDSRLAQNLGVRLATVERAEINRSTLAAGVIAFNERTLAIVQARTGGFVERGYGRAIGDVLQEGAPIVDVRAPEWTAAQAEYLALRNAGGDIAQAARRRLTMLGMPSSLVSRIEREGAPRAVFTLTAPVAGAITSLDIRPGMTVVPGATLATINGLSPVWLVVSLPQSDAALARPGGRVAATLPAYPGESFAGRIEAVLPAANPETRTVEVRIALDNRSGRLRPGMSAEARVGEEARTALVIPAEAVIRTGARSIVIVAREQEGYAPTEVVLGRQQGDVIEIRSGLSEGQRIVASGQFLIDSEANLSGAVARLNTSVAANTAARHETTGRVAAINGAELMIAHAPIASLNWPAMTMQFRLARPELARGLAVGDTIAFRFERIGDAYVIDELHEGRGP